VTHNMGRIEKVVRLLLGIILFAVGWLVLGGYGVFVSAVTNVTVAGLVIAIIGAVIFITGLASWCPVNALVHHNSCEACRTGETHRHLPV